MKRRNTDVLYPGDLDAVRELESEVAREEVPIYEA